jgi:hypothetical protein
MMVLEHDRAGDLLTAVRGASGAYVVPDRGCASYRSLSERLEALEPDTHLHIHDKGPRPPRAAADQRQWGIPVPKGPMETSATWRGSCDALPGCHPRSAGPAGPGANKRDG